MFVNGMTAMDFSRTTAAGWGVAARERDVVGEARSVDATCAPVAYRSAGDLSRSRATSASTSAETSSRDDVTGGGVCTNRLAIVACALAPMNATSPVSISYSTQPNANRSLRPSSSSPVTCSGLM
jgi:hypothetical protein